VASYFYDLLQLAAHASIDMVCVHALADPDPSTAAKSTRASRLPLAPFVQSWTTAVSSTFFSAEELRQPSNVPRGAPRALVT
jgi:hypothetical protein